MLARLRFLRSRRVRRLVPFSFVALFLFSQAAFGANCCVFSASDSSSSTAASASVKSSNRDFSTIYAEYQEKLRANAKICDERGMTLEARITRSLLDQNDSYLFVFPTLKKEPQPSELPADASSEQRSWYAALRKLRRRYAEETFELAKRRAAEKRGWDAFACAQTALYIDPDCEGARRFFGYKLRDGAWRTDWEIKRLDAGEVETERFGWLPKENVERYEKGERNYRNRWISEADEAKKILASSSGWRVETEHFTILSRVSLERGVEIGRFLENYYNVWLQLYYRFVATEPQWTSRFNGKGAVLSKRFKVIVYQNREEYLGELRKHDEKIDASIGWYLPKMRCIFAYEPSPNEEFEFDLLSLLAHEATHQLFNECYLATSNRNKPVANPGDRANFWALEGVAVYMETYALTAANARLGGVDAYRLQQAVASCLDEKTYVPLRRYAAASRQTFQTADDLQLFYAQAAGLTYFFVHHREGVYRNAFIAYLYAVYQGIDRADSLERLTGRSFEELDAEYREFLQGVRAASSEARRR
ncbi:MAG: DUF1570 domain-containing protein [Thermoguttaceae bacterium]|nr:DUF1570 domain-containing protein [Thermoguttaceae bacterium]